MVLILQSFKSIFKDLENMKVGPKKLKQCKKIDWKSHGCEINFEIKDQDENIKVFTTRPDTIFGNLYRIISRSPQVKNMQRTKLFKNLKQNATKQALLRKHCQC